MVDLGEYSSYVLGAYGLSLLLLAWIVFVSVRRAAKVRKALEEVEGRDG